MPVGSGLSAQLMIAKETTPGTAVTVTRPLEFNSESLALTKNIVQGAGLRGGGRTLARSSRRAYTTRTVGGDINLDVATKGMGLLFEQMMGSSTSAVIGATTAYQQVHTLGQLTGKSMTVQVGRPTTAGVVQPFTYRGCKVTSWELACEVGGILTLSLTLDGWDETTGTALATPAFPASTEVFHFAQGALVLGGTVATASGVASLTGGTTVATVTGATVTGEQSLAAERFFFGSAGVKAEQLENDWPTVSGSLDAEFTDLTSVYNTFSSDAATALRLRFTGTTAISGSEFPTLEVLLPSIRFDTGAPGVDGPDVLSFGADFTALDDGTNTGAQIRYVTADTAL